jgi:hypothetical protein
MPPARAGTRSSTMTRLRFKWRAGVLIAFHTAIADLDSCSASRQRHGHQDSVRCSARPV